MAATALRHRRFKSNVSDVEYYNLTASAIVYDGMITAIVAATGHVLTAATAFVDTTHRVIGVAQESQTETTGVATTTKPLPVRKGQIEEFNAPALALEANLGRAVVATDSNTLALTASATDTRRLGIIREIVDANTIAVEITLAQGVA